MDTVTHDWRAVAMRRLVTPVNFALRHRWLLISIPLAAAAISLWGSRNAARTYSAQAKFITQGTRQQPATGLAAQLIGSAGGATGDLTNTPEFYTELLTSRPVLERTAEATFDVPTAVNGSKKQTLAQFYGTENAAVGVLAGSITSAITPKTGSITVLVTSSSPSLAEEITGKLLDELSDFNKERRQSRAAAERQFTQARLAEADSELRQAESALTDFYTRNRGFERSPELKFQESSLTREATRRQALYTTLAQAYEQARIDEVRDTPVITVIERPRSSGAPNARHRLERMAIAATIGFFAALLLAFILETRKTWSLPETEEFEELRGLSREALLDVRNPTRVVRRMWS